jgi:predicted transcriptional regulator
MKSVSHIFGGEAKVKIMRLFVFNQEMVFSASTVAERVKERSSLVRKELLNLSKSGLVLKRARGYVLNPAYRYLPAVEHFLIDASPLSQKEIIKKLSRAGTLKLVLVSGIFMHDREARVDLLVVGDHLKNARLVSAVSALEAEIGRELRYAAFETPDFRYRLGIYDKLIRDILDYPHEKLINKIGV